MVKKEKKAPTGAWFFQKTHLQNFDKNEHFSHFWTPFKEEKGQIGPKQGHFYSSFRGVSSRKLH